MTSEENESVVFGFKLSPSTVEMIRSDVKTAASYETFCQDTVKLSEKAPVFVSIVMPDNKAIIGVEIERRDDEKDPLIYANPPAEAVSETILNVRTEISKNGDECYWCIGVGPFEICILKPFCR